MAAMAWCDSLWTLGYKVRWLLLMTSLLCYCGECVGQIEQVSCEPVKTYYAGMGLSVNVPNKAGANQLNICATGITCCTREHEAKFVEHGMKQFNQLLQEKLKGLLQLFQTRTKKFDGFFTQLLSDSKNKLHSLFDQTYGVLYRLNSYVFMELFQDLLAYYKHGHQEPTEVLDKFFATLLQRVFQLVNQQYTFDQQYLQCATEGMDKLQPFGTIPGQLTVQLKRAFVAARTFVQGLSTGELVVNIISKIQLNPMCSQGWVKLMYCSACRENMVGRKPCNNYCMTVMRGCLADLLSLNDQWNKYIEALTKVATRLQGPFNIESVVDPMNVKISEAIMNFQENSDYISEEIYKGCGNPERIRHKRDTSFDATWSAHNNQELEPGRSGLTLEKLVLDIKDKVKVVTDFWRQLSDKICQDVATPVNVTTNCWNGGVEIGHGYQRDDAQTDTNEVIKQQILHLKIITGKLNNAYDGVDVVEAEVGPWMTSGSGDSWSGSGMDPGSGIYIHVEDKTPSPRYPPGANPPEHMPPPRPPGSGVSRGSGSVLALLALLALYYFIR